MATIRFSVNPGASAISGSSSGVTEAAGDPVVADAVEVTVNLSPTLIGNSSGGRRILKSEVHDALTKIRDYVDKSDWPPNVPLV